MAAIVTPLQRIGTGVRQLTDSDPSNNMQGVRDIALGAVQATSVTAAALDQYLLRHGMNLSQLAMPSIGPSLRDRFLNPQNLAGQLLATGIQMGVRSALQSEPEEQKQKQAEAEKRANEAEQKARAREDERVAAARRIEQEKFLRPDIDRNRLEKDAHAPKPKVSLV